MKAGTISPLRIVLPALLLGLLAWAPVARAQIFGAPQPSVGKGQFAVGAALADYKRSLRVGNLASNSVDNSRETLFLDYGLRENGMLRIELGTVDLGDARGEELAVGYRGSLGKRDKVGGKKLNIQLGYFGSLRSASVSAAGAESDFLQLDLGAGGLIVINPTAAAYFAGVFSYLDGDSAGVGFEADSNLGLIGGGYMEFDKAIRVGGEIHLLFQTGIGLYFRMVF